ncbi:hypothetical protein SynSYN20_02020 [Synechococcus sp. SYN20]|nr:hypothetical protein SynSYN20_02020 [Synechococcus sp. SYN20]
MDPPCWPQNESREGAKKIRTRRMSAESLMGQELITFSWLSARIED